MKLTGNGTSFLGDCPHATYRERIDPDRAQAVLIAQGRHPTIARVLSEGGHRAALNISAGTARECGADVGLLVREPR